MEGFRARVRWSQRDALRPVLLVGLLVFGSDRRGLQARRERVIDEAGADLLHRDPLELVPGAEIDSRQCAAAQLLGALRSNIDEEKTARDRRCHSLRTVAAFDNRFL
mgnify:FL=1